VTEQPYPPLRPQPPVRPRRRATPWPVIIGVVLLAILTTVLILLLSNLGGDGTGSSPSPGATASGDPSASPGGSQPASSASAVPSAAGESGAPVGIAVDSVVETAVEGLSIRQGPSTSAERLGSLELGATSYVAGGPADADGFRWYLISTFGLPPNTGCAGEPETDPYNCPAWFGWAAAASEAGETWLRPHELECPSEPLTAESLILAQTNLGRLACLGAEPFTFRGWWPEIPDDAGLGGACAGQEEPSGWLLCQNINHNAVMIDETQGFEGVGARVSIDPASGLSMPERGTWIELRVHLDDPAAQGCDEAAAAVGEAERPPERYVLDCRAEMVLEAVTPVDGP
jgi:hypothetical protein